MFNPSVQVTITDSSPNAQIFFTTDGSTPTTASTVYTGPMTVTNTENDQSHWRGAQVYPRQPGFGEHVHADYASADAEVQPRAWRLFIAAIGGHHDYSCRRPRFITPRTEPRQTTASTPYTGPVPINVSKDTEKPFAYPRRM